MRPSPCLLAAAALLAALPAAAGDAKGSLLHRGTNVPLQHAYLVKGPDAVDPSLTIRRLILSKTDLSAKLAACKTMSCTDGEVMEGMTVDLGAGPRLNYWMSIGGQRIQHSGTAKPEVMKTTADTPERLAGTLQFDDSVSSGPKVDVSFDATLLGSFDAAR